MNSYEVTRMVYSRVQAMEPDVASKIMGYLFLQDHCEQEILKLALCSDAQLQALVANAKQQLGLASSPLLNQSSMSLPLPSLSTSTTPLRPRFRSPAPLIIPQLDPMISNYIGAEEGTSLTSVGAQNLHAHHQQAAATAPLSANLLGDDQQLIANDVFTPDLPKFHQHQAPSHHLMEPNASFSPMFFSPRPKISSIGSRHSSQSDISLSPDRFGNGFLSPGGARKPCLYYARGYCKHGSSCRFLHSHAPRSDPASPSFSSASSTGGQFDIRSDEGFVHGSLERLEAELQELLRGLRTPVSIASLPQLYYERYGRTLQAEGYLTESQRHGKAGYSLTKLLARLKTTVTLIDRPHGQHAVILAEDALRFTGYRGEREVLANTVNPGSCQIYLTFPAESTFLEEDVFKHFSEYGLVQDVRIPFQQKRMFGFVTFVYPETVRVILTEGNPHYIRGSRVLVKPYKEKAKSTTDRIKMAEREYSRFLSSRSFDGREFNPFPSGIQFLDDHDLLRRQLINEQALELERGRFADWHFADPPRLFLERRRSSLREQVSVEVSNFGESENLPNSTVEDLSALQAANAFGYLLDVLDGDDDKPTREAAAPKNETQTEPSSDMEHNLPDSPFDSPHANDRGHSPFSLDLCNANERSRSSSLQQLPSSFFLPPDSLSSQAPSFGDNDTTCPICRDFFVDPVPLDCSHIFCTQCMLKVIRVCKDECPVCGRHIGSQVVKLLENRGLPLICPSLTRPREAAGQVTSW